MNMQVSRVLGSPQWQLCQESWSLWRNPRVHKKAPHAADVVRDQAPKAGEHLADAARAAAAMVTSKGKDEGAQGAASAGGQP